MISTFLTIGNLYSYNDKLSGFTNLMVYLGERYDRHEFYLIHDSMGTYVTQKIYRLTQLQLVRLIHAKEFKEVYTDVT